MDRFVHLHVHSEYSLLDGAARIEELAARAAELGMTALALTDHGVMYGAVAFYKACVKHGIKPIIGCEVYFTEGSAYERGSRQEQPMYHLILLARNMKGYRNLMKLCSIAHLQCFHYKPRIDGELLERHAEGLICLSSCLGGEVSQHLLHGRREQAKAAAERYRRIFGDHFYLELQDHGLVEQKKVMSEMIELSRETGIPLIATNDVHYVRPADHAVQDVLVCIGTGKTLESEDRLRFTTDQMYLKSGEEMARLFAHVPEALANTLKVADMCELELEFGRQILPQFRPIPEGRTAGQYLAELCREGLVRRYGNTPLWDDPVKRRNAEERLEYELGVIERMGYSDYFLIVWDFIRFAHERGIATGPGRGSSAGSLVAYVLNITDVDPLRYRLLFERFLNPERVSMPDIDIDFSDERRDEVIAYVVDKYGEDHVAQIITFGTMAARAAVRDVGRAMNLPYSDVDRAARMIPFRLGMTIEEALAVNPELKALAAKHPKTADLLRMAMRVEGMPRHASTHAAGVVISREPLTDYVPLQEGAEGIPLTQYSMEHLEAIGLLKMDFLGLRTLSIIERTLKWIEETEGVRLDLRKLPDDDPLTYELLSRGDTTGIFQLESPGMRRVLKELKPSTFEDIISVLALYRPGPMEFIPKYIAAKNGLIEVEYPHPSLEPILRDTYGIIVYQEQIMQIAAKMAGFSLGEADLLRRAVSKKKREVLDEERAHFVQGSLRQGYSEEEANKVYDMIVRFADYGFPRAHATAYGVLAYQTAYLKAHYPVPFMAAMLTAAMGNHRKVAEYIDDCRRMKIDVLPPDVNESGVTFTPVPSRRSDHRAESGARQPAHGAKTDAHRTGDRAGFREGGNGAPADQAEARSEASADSAGDSIGSIRFGLAAIKNVGTQAIEAILRERKDRPYDDLPDFCRRVDLRVCNKRVIEALIQGGAMDSLPGHRAQLIAMLEETVEAALKWKKEREDLQLHLFGFTEEIHWTVEYPPVSPYTPAEQLEMEKELLGMYLSGHPLDAYESLLRELDADPLHQLIDLPDQSEALVAGMVASCKNIVTRNGQTMAFAELENRIDKIEVVFFPKTWATCGNLVQKGRLLLVRGRLQHEEDAVKCFADFVCGLDDPDVRLKVRARPRPQPLSATSAGRTAPGRTIAASAPAARAAAGSLSRAATLSPAPGATPASGGAAARQQRVFIKIDAAHENAQSLARLQKLLQQHSGPLNVILFYERSQTTLRLSEKYNVKPSPKLFQAIEALLGPRTVRVK